MRFAGILARVAMVVCIAAAAVPAADRAAAGAKEEGSPPAPSRRDHTTATARERELWRELDVMEQRLFEIESKMQDYSSQVVDARRRLTGLEKELQGVKKDLKTVRRKARKRLVAYYKFNQMNYVTPLLMVRDFRTAIDAGYATARLVRMDREVLQSLRERVVRIRAIETELARQQAALKRLQAGLRTEQKELVSLKDEKVRLLVSVHQQVREAQARELERSAPQPAGIDTAPDRGAATPAATPPFSRQRGRLPMPTRGTIVPTYGEKRNAPDNAILYNNGIVIRAPKGQKIQAVHAGKVMFADWFRGYGKVMIIDHGEHYYSLIAFADRLLKKTGERVLAGEVVATVGDSGSFDGAKLYFEIRHHGQPVNPMEWLAT